MSLLSNVPRMMCKDAMRIPTKLGKQNQVSHRQINDGPSDPGSREDSKSNKTDLIHTQKYMSVTYLPYPDFDWEQKSTCFNILCNDQIGELIKSRNTIRKVHSEAKVKPKDEYEEDVNIIPTADKMVVNNVKAENSNADIYAVYPLHIPQDVNFTNDNIAPEEMPAVEELIRTINKIKSVDHIKMSLALREKERRARGSARIVLPKMDETLKTLLCYMYKQSKSNKKEESCLRKSASRPNNKK